MKKIITANDVFEVERALNIVMDEHIKLPLNIALKLVKVKRELSDITEYVASRIVELIPKIGKPDGTDLTDQEKFLYSGVMTSQVEVDNQDVVYTDFSDACEILVELGVADKLSMLF